MPSLGPLEILAVAVVGLIVFGPERLPGIARQIGRTATNLRRMAEEMRQEFKEGLDLDEEPAAPSQRRTAADSAHPLADPPAPRRSKAPVGESPAPYGARSKTSMPPMARGLTPIDEESDEGSRP